MSAGPDIAKTHDVGERISWTLRPPISTKINLVRLENGDEYDVPEGKPMPKVGDQAHGSKVVEVLTWEDRRERMQKVCFGCHSTSVIEGHYLDASNADAFVGMAVAYLHGRDYPLARASLEEAKRLDPGRQAKLDALIAYIDQRAGAGGVPTGH